MYKIAVMGERESIITFSALGMSVFFSEEENEAKNILKKLSENNFGIIYITKKLADKIKDDINKYYFNFKPAIIIIPSIAETDNTKDVLNDGISEYFG